MRGAVWHMGNDIDAVASRLKNMRSQTYFTLLRETEISKKELESITRQIEQARDILSKVAEEVRQKTPPATPHGDT